MAVRSLHQRYWARQVGSVTQKTWTRRRAHWQPDPQGKQYWLDYLTSHGNTASARKHIALGFFTSLEAYKGDVTGWFEEYLQRPPTTEELNQYAQ